MNDTFVDINGQTVSVGDRVAYPVRFASHMEVKIATVLAISFDPSQPGWNQWQIQVRAFGGKKPSVLTVKERIVKVPS